MLSGLVVDPTKPLLKGHFEAAQAKKALFKIDPISKWIVWSTMTNIIVNQLEEIVNKDNSPDKKIQNGFSSMFQETSTQQTSLYVSNINDENMNPNSELNIKI